MKIFLSKAAGIFLIILAGYFLFNAFSFNDRSQPVYTPNMITNLSVIPDHRTCGTVEMYNLLSKQYPEYKINRELIEKQTEEYIKSHKNDNSRVVITLPVVVHVVYHTASQNISDEQVLSQIAVLNKDYRRLNADTVNTPSPFKPLGADIQVEFCMARRDPNNNPTTGITRTFTNNTLFGLDNAVKFTASGGIDGWDRNRYLNIWVCNLGDNLLGYAEYPGGPASTDGVVILYSAFGNTGFVSPPYNLGRTATHEVGHWFNLIHIWGDDNGSCAGSDLVADTPNQAGENYGCPGFPRLDACSPTFPGVMSMDYMDYTDDNCMNIFTMGQSARMNAALNGPRNPIITSNGCQNVSGIPIASFTSDSTSIIYGSSVHLTDNSAGIPTGWLWTCTGGNPSGSASQNPTISYTNPGYYTVKLKVTNSFGTDSVTKVNYIKVRGANMSSFNLVSPPMFERIITSPNDLTIQNFTWGNSAAGPLVRYKMKIKKIGSPTEYNFNSNSGGTDTAMSLRKSYLDTLAALMGTANGDSVQCVWRAWVYNGIDSLASANSFVVTFARNPIGIQNISSVIPVKFMLYNNYPNPFNPGTTFKFDVAKSQHIKLTVYDLLGRVVEILYDGFLQPGKYSASWNAANYSSGVYYYKLESDAFSDVKKMVLLK